MLSVTAWPEKLKLIYLLLAIAWRLHAQLPPDQDIRSILEERIDRLHQGVGMVVGIVDRSGRRFVSYGNFGADDARPVDEDTVFEIGSVTKVFTSTILADMVRRGEVALGDPVAKYLPPHVKMPQRGAKQIALLDLATHTSGLPRMPADFYGDYTLENLFQFLSQFQLPRNAGSKFEYSNLGAGLLGQALARRAGMDYEALVRARVTEPLGMANTGIALTPAMREHFAPGYDSTRDPAPNWDLPVFAGAGALRSSARDLLTFVAAHLGYVESPLAPAMQSMTKVRRKAGDGYEMALGWIVTNRHGRQIFWHDGSTFGYQAFAGYDAKAGVGVIALSNMDVDVSDIGMHLLDPSAQLETLRPLVADEEKPDPAFAASPEFSGLLERVRSGSISVRLADGRVIDAVLPDAVLPDTADLAAGVIAAQYHLADRVQAACRPIKPFYDAKAFLHQYLELKSLRLLRPATPEELAGEVALLSWHTGENLLKRPDPVRAGDDAAAANEWERVRRVNVEYLSKLPDFVADETAWRYRSSMTSRRWRLLDTIDLEIALRSHPGRGSPWTRRNIRLNGLPWNRPLPFVRWFTFGIELNAFDPECTTKIEFVERQEVSGKSLLVYRFSSPPGGCFLTWENGGNRYNPARTGRILVDAARGNIIRYEEEASGYPAKFGIDWSTMVENWGNVMIGESSWLAPVSAELIVRMSNGNLLRMSVEYKNHRHFEASTKITFGKER
ncbi:hypothetical protein SBA4_4530012 [Candidatus Sulfopaludibacter sp. SbA4]|nr:hypothetical protein SBA4_4530012 [Candidatus Sulfopaludibacter sp. SbA4]